jgi:phage-related protein
MNAIGPGVFELRDQDERAWYRVIYLAKVRNVIHVLHCFEKRHRKTPVKEINTARQRLKAVRARMIQEKKHGGRTQ